MTHIFPEFTKPILVFFFFQPAFYTIFFYFVLYKILYIVCIISNINITPYTTQEQQQKSTTHTLKGSVECVYFRKNIFFLFFSTITRKKLFMRNYTHIEKKNNRGNGCVYMRCFLLFPNKTFTFF